jgi:LPS export ABC transporter protein LptC
VQKIHFSIIKLIAFLPSLFLSCSLNYNDAQNKQSLSPEFVFHDAHFKRTEDGAVKLLFIADKIEQYSGVDEMYGINMNFSTFDSQGTKTVEGHCNLFSADNSNKLYQLFDKVTINSYKNNAEIIAESLKWNGKTETLVSTADNPVTITIDKLIITGIGFAASGKDTSYSLQKNVTGMYSDTIQNNDKSIIVGDINEN